MRGIGMTGEALLAVRRVARNNQTTIGAMNDTICHTVSY